MQVWWAILHPIIMLINLQVLAIFTGNINCNSTHFYLSSMSFLCHHFCLFWSSINPIWLQNDRQPPRVTLRYLDMCCFCCIQQQCKQPSKRLHCRTLWNKRFIGKVFFEWILCFKERKYFCVVITALTEQEYPLLASFVPRWQHFRFLVVFWHLFSKHVSYLLADLLASMTPATTIADRIKNPNCLFMA